MMQESIGRTVKKSVRESHTKGEHYQTINPDYYKSLPKEQRYTRVEPKDTAREIVKGLMAQNIPYSAVVRKNDTVAVTVSKENSQAFKQIEKVVKSKRDVELTDRINDGKSTVASDKKDSRRAYFSRSKMQRDVRRINGRGQQKPQQTAKWNDATDNRDKSLISIQLADFQRMQDALEKSGINYYAYEMNGIVRMAVNDKDVDWLKNILGDMSVMKSNRPYSPPEKNIIGNAEYRYIPQKEYLSADRDLVLKMAEIMTQRGIQFSGRIYPTGKGTLTVSHNDIYAVKEIQKSVTEMRKQFHQAEKIPTEEDIMFSQADLAKFLAERTPSSDEWEDMAYPLFENGYLGKHKPSDKVAFGYHMNEPAFYDLAHRYHDGEDIRKELALGLLEGNTAADIEFVFEQGVMSDRTYYYAENLRHSLHFERTEDGYMCSFGGMERFVSFEEIGQAFIDRIHEEFEDLMYWRVLDYIRDDIPDISDDTVRELMTAFDGSAMADWEKGDNKPKINRIKKALYDILGDEQQTEKAFACIAKQKYNVNFEAKKTKSSIHFGLLGNGITAYDVSRTDPETHDYPTVAHISPEGVVKIYDNSISAEDIERINEQARLSREKFMTDWNMLSHVQQFQKLLDRADISTTVNIGKEKLSMEEKIEKYMPFVFFGEGERPEPQMEEQVKGTYKIYQLPDGEKYHGIRFEGKEQLEKDGVQLNHEDYELVYEGEIDDFKGNATLEAIFTQFNTAHPADFSGHSLSVSDVIVISADGKESAYYCDSFGFVEMPEFFKEKELLQEKSAVHEITFLGNRNGFDAVNAVTNNDSFGTTVADGDTLTVVINDNADMKDVRRLVETAQDNGVYLNIPSAKMLESRFDADFMQESHKPSVADLEVGDVIMYDGARREVKSISDMSISLKDLDAPDFGGVLLGTSDVLAYDGWQEDMESKGFDILSKAEKTEPENKGPVSLRKVGDFYEMYGKNAEIGAEVLSLHMLSKNGSHMVGFPDHTKNEYSKKLSDAGYSVLIEQAFELNPPKREPEKLQTLQQVVDKFFGTDCESAETEGGTWKLSISNGDKVGELFYGGEPVCGIYNRGDKMEIEPYRELSTFPKLLQTAMLEHTPDKPVEIMDFQRTYETPLDKAKYLINNFCESEYDSQADFSNLHEIHIAYTTLTDDELPIQITADLIDFKITYEFDGEVFSTEEYSDIEDMIENGLTGLDFNELVSVPDSVIEKHTAKNEQTIEQMSDSEDIDKPLFTDAAVIDEIQRNEYSDTPFWETPDIQGEQLTLFGDSEPLTALKPAKEKPKSEFAKGPVVNGVQVYEALQRKLIVEQAL